MMYRVKQESYKCLVQLQLDGSGAIFSMPEGAICSLGFNIVKSDSVDFYSGLLTGIAMYFAG